MYSVALLALVGGLATAPADTTYNGVTLPGSVQASGNTLVLNGVALRKKAIFKVYVAGLYLPEKASNADAVLAADTPRHLVMQFLRDVGKDKMCEAWDESLKNNTPNAGQDLKAQFATLCNWMDDIKKSEQFVFTYLPGKGTDVTVAGKSKGTLPGKEFADALFKSWIGPKPGPGEGFKKNLLGIK
jgi:chalcone isomerase-like protein